MFCRNDALKAFAILTGKHLCWSLFFNKVANGCFCKVSTLLLVLGEKTAFNNRATTRTTQGYKIKNFQKQPFRGVRKKKCYENMQQIYRRTTMPKCSFNKAAKQLYWSCTSAWVFSCKFVAYFHFRTLFPKNISGGLLQIFQGILDNVEQRKGSLKHKWLRKKCLCFFFKDTLMLWQYLCLHIKIICWKLHFKTHFTFWDMRTWDMLKVCLPTFRNNRTC